MNKLCKEIHTKNIVRVKGEFYCKHCDWGYLDTINNSDIERLEEE